MYAVLIGLLASGKRQDYTQGEDTVDRFKRAMTAISFGDRQNALTAVAVSGLRRNRETVHEIDLSDKRIPNLDQQLIVLDGAIKLDPLEIVC